jgi:hypothetical protein
MVGAMTNRFVRYAMLVAALAVSLSLAGPTLAKGGGGGGGVKGAKTNLTDASGRVVGGAELFRGALHDKLVVAVKLPGSPGAILDVSADGASLGVIDLNAKGEGTESFEPAPNTIASTAVIAVKDGAGAVVASGQLA